MTVRSKRRRLFKFFLVALGVCALLGGGIKVYTAYRLNDFAQSLQRAKEKHSELQKDKANLQAASAHPEAVVGSPQHAISHAADDSKASRQTRKSRQASACSPVYQKYVENRRVQEAVAAGVDDLMAMEGSDLENDPCVQQVTELIDPEYLVGLLEKCKAGADADKKERSCFTMAALIWSVFAELEYRDVDPSEIPVHALHSKINFRLADDTKFFKEAEPKDRVYLFRLMDQMHKLRPDIDYGTARDELIADLYKSNPDAWRDDFKRTLDELEHENLLRAITTFYNGSGGKADRPFLEYVEGLATQHPKSQVVHIYKGLAHASLGEWDLATSELVTAEGLATEENARLLTDLRSSIQEKKASISTYTWQTLKLDLPDPRPNN